MTAIFPRSYLFGCAIHSVGHLEGQGEGVEGEGVEGEGVGGEGGKGEAVEGEGL